MLTTELTPNAALGGQTWNTFTAQSRPNAREFVDAIGVLLQGVVDSYAGRDP